MFFSRILGRKTADLPAAKGVDVCAMVNGKLSNQQICEEMLEGVTEDPKVTAHVIDMVMGMGVSKEDAHKYWGSGLTA